MISWAYFKENIGHFDIHAPTLRKIKRKWEKFSFEKKKKFISKFLKKFDQKKLLIFFQMKIFSISFNFSQS